MKPYDRMNPDDRLLEKLEEYAKINYGTNAYSLSTAEANYLLNVIKTLDSQLVGVAILFDEVNDELKALQKDIENGQ